MRLILVVISLLAVGACGAPRGAAFQSEVVGNENTTHSDIAVYRVTRESLPKISKWPAADSKKSYSWPGKGAVGSDKPIRAFDRVNITVWDSEEDSLLSSPSQNTVSMQDMQVSAGGTIFLPFVGTVHIAGLSQPSARARIQRKYEEVIPSAQVQLGVQQGVRGSVSVVAGVSDPGPIPLEDPNMTVLNAIATSGGPQQSLKNPQVKLIRGGRTYMRSLDHVMSHSSADVALRPGDKIALVSDSRYFRSLGAASKEAIVPFSQSKVTALDAMSMIGGLSDNRANPKGILVLRDYPSKAVRNDGSGPENERTVFVIDLTTADGLFSAGKFDVQDRDTVLVTESTIASASVLLGVLRQLTGITYDISRL